MTPGLGFVALRAVSRVTSFLLARTATHTSFRNYSVKDPRAEDDGTSQSSKVAPYNPPVNQAYIHAKMQSVGANEATLQLQVSEETLNLANTFGTLQGGIVSTLHDMVGSQAIRTIGRLGAHTNLSTQFINPIPLVIGNIINGWAQVKKSGQSVAFVHSTISVNGVEASHAQHTYSLKPIEK